MRATTEEKRAAYEAKLLAMTDDELVKAAENEVWFSAFAANNPRAPAHWMVDMVSDEAQRREKPWLYQQGWNKAYRLCGYEPGESDIERAKPPTTEAADAP